MKFWARMPNSGTYMKKNHTREKKLFEKKETHPTAHIQNWLNFYQTE